MRTETEYRNRHLLSTLADAAASPLRRITFFCVAVAFTSAGVAGCSRSDPVGPDGPPTHPVAIETDAPGELPFERVRAAAEDALGRLQPSLGPSRSSELRVALDRLTDTVRRGERDEVALTELDQALSEAETALSHDPDAVFELTPIRLLILRARSMWTSAR